MWKEMYIEDVFFSSGDQTIISRGIQLKNRNMPQLLYKYRAPTKNSIDALLNNFAYSVSPEACNDINECPLTFDIIEIERNILLNLLLQLPPDDVAMLIRISESNEPDEIIKLLSIYHTHQSEQKYPQEMKERLVEIRKKNCSLMDQMIDSYYLKMKNSYNIYCLTENYDDDLMWSHYADNHKGFCLGYNIKEFNQSICELTLPVVYTDRPLLVYDLDKLTGVELMYALTLKKQCWAYEKEWRIFYPVNTPYHKEQMPLPSVLYLGCRIDNKTKKKLVDFCISNSIPLFQMALDLTTHHLIAKKL